MNSLTPWLHILLAILAYFVVAALAFIIVRRSGGDLTQIHGRTSFRVLLIGAIANLLVLAIVLLLLVLVNQKPISALGLAFDSADALFPIAAMALTFGLAIMFVVVLKRTGHFQVTT